MHWCIDCHSALAEAEVEYADRTSPAVDVRFTVADEAEFLGRCLSTPEGTARSAFRIWTTTPWTLPANQAVALHPALEYQLLACTGPQGPGRLLIAEPLVKVAMARYGIEEYRVVANCRGADLEGVKLRHPFYAREVPVILGDHVTTDAGTGAVPRRRATASRTMSSASATACAVHNPGRRRRQVPRRHRAVRRRTCIQGQRTRG